MDIRDKDIWRHPIGVLASGFGAGHAPKAPGTFGTLVAVPVVVAMGPLPLWSYSLTVLALALAGVGICNWVSDRLGGRDHPAIVWDEIVGFLVTMWALQPDVATIVAAFLLFRFFDIVKPWPIGYLDRRVHSGLGIMLDDVVAGAMACAILHVALSAMAS